MKSNRRLPLLAGGIISLLVMFALLGGESSVLARGKHHPPMHHHQPPTHSTVVPDVPPPACFPTTGSVPTIVSVKCVNFAFFTPPFALSVTPDCAAMGVTDSEGAAVARTSGGWVLQMPTTGNLSFSLDGTGCANGTYQFSLDQPAGGHMASFSQSF